MGPENAPPPAFRRHPYDALTDEDLIALGKRVLAHAALEDPHSTERAVKLAAYDSVVLELQRRLVNRVNAECSLGLPDL